MTAKEEEPLWNRFDPRGSSLPSQRASYDRLIKAITGLISLHTVRLRYAIMARHWTSALGTAKSAVQGSADQN
jgi:hypothetical protein